MRALIVANGSPLSVAYLRSLCFETDLIVLTDGAANHWDPSLPTPHYVLGDFDSIDPFHFANLSKSQRIDAPDQDATDLEKAVIHVLRLGANSIRIAAWEGDRQDHMLGAVSLLFKYSDVVNLKLVSPQSNIFACTGVAEVSGQIGDTISLIAFDEIPSISMSGVKWPLVSEKITSGTRGISNIFADPLVRICVAGGTVIICHISNKYC